MGKDEQPDRRPRRQRRLPHRRSDRIEALTTWGLCSLAAVLVVVVALAGSWAHNAASDEVRQEHGDRQPTVAVALSSVPAVATDRGAPAYGDVRWTAADGSVRTGTAQVPPMTAAGNEVTVWTNDQGELVAPPLGSEFPLVMTAMAVVFAVALGGAVLVLARVGERRLLGRLRAAEWEAEWRRVEPGWSGREGSERR